MQLHGLNKLTLLDFPGHLAGTVFTGACNFRCPFCHNAPLVLSPGLCEVIPEEEFFSFLASRKGKLEGVCITGGEPTLQPDLPEFIKKIKESGFLVKLDTNGYAPAVLSRLLKENLLDAVAMDIKNDKENYAATAGRLPDVFDIECIEESISLLISSGLPHEFRTTVVKELHGIPQMQGIGQWLAALSAAQGKGSVCTSPYFLQDFRPSENLICGSESAFHAHDKETLLSFAALLKPYVPNTALRGQ